MNVSIVLCTHNRADALRMTLRSLSLQRVPHGVSWEVLVVDNASTDHTARVAKEAASILPCRYAFEPRVGKSFALNTAARDVAASDLLLFTDDDIVAHEDWVSVMWQTFSQTDCAAAGGRVVPVWPMPKPPWYDDSGEYSLMPGALVHYDHGGGTRVIPDLPYGANMAFRKGVLDTFGGFNPQLGPRGRTLMRGEDTDYCRRIRAAGGKILYVGDAVIYHPVTMERMKKSYFSRWYFQYGRKDILLEPERVTTHLWFGVPRYLIHRIAEASLRWVTTTDPRRRFYHRLECSRLLGQAAEYWRPSARNGGP
ncbi:MAG TPA: glycosyltransferase [Gemmatimonadaceae bacterium]|nr:glycosyltransferase [Gemmatimonadaceae bacterium]